VAVTLWENLGLEPTKSFLATAQNNYAQQLKAFVCRERILESTQKVQTRKYAKNIFFYTLTQVRLTQFQHISDNVKHFRKLEISTM